MPQPNYRLAFAGFVLTATASVAHANQYGYLETLEPDMPKLFEGDILTSDDTLFTRSIGTGRSGAQWDYGIMHYTIDALMEQDSIDAIHEAAEKWNELGSITLVEISALDVDDYRDHVVFTSGPGCASWVGRQGDSQDIWVAPSCTVGSIMHEIGHALGLEHEHTRVDRDQYVIINWDNVDPTKMANFDVAPSNSRLVGGYDYESIMHYGALYFSVDGSPTIEPINYSGPAIGQRDQPSAGDLETIERIYATDLSLVTELYSASDGSEIKLYVSNMHVQGANTIKLTVDTGSVALVSVDNDDWTCDKDAKPVVCELTKLAGSSESNVVLTFNGTVTEADLKTNLSSKTFDLDTSNNGGEIMLAAANNMDALGSTPGEPDALYSQVALTPGGGSPSAPLIALMSLFASLKMKLRLFPF